jgi:hypothetical protein
LLSVWHFLNNLENPHQSLEILDLTNLSIHI